MKIKNLLLAAIFFATTQAWADKPQQVNCHKYEITRVAAAQAVADWDFVCSNMVMNGEYSSISYEPYVDMATGDCRVKVAVSGIVNGTSKSCNGNSKVVAVKDNVITTVTK